MNEPTIEQSFKELIDDISRVSSQNERVMLYEHDLDVLRRALTMLGIRAADVQEINKLCDKLDAENGILKELIAQHEADTREWQITIRGLQDQMDKMRRQTVHLDRVREVLGMAEFTLNVVSRSYGMPIDAVAMFDNLVAQLRSELIYTPDDDIPF